MGKRIYYVAADYNYSEEPTTHLAYWDSDTGEITRVWPNIRDDLGTGYMARRPSGELVVMGQRSSHWTPYTALINGGDYWSGDADQVDLSSDVVLYTVDADLQNPTPLLTDAMGPGAWFRGELEGWQAQNLAPLAYDFNSEHSLPFIAPNGQILVAGWRNQSFEADPYRGSMFHVYNADGTLVRRGFPQSGEGADYEQGQVISGLDAGIAWAVHDSTRGLLYYYDGYSVWRYAVATGETTYAPTVFPWVQTQQGWENNFVQNFRNNPDYLVQGPYPYSTSSGTPAYAFIEEKDYWRSRQAHAFAVEERTGYLWAITHGYEPYGQEYAEPGDGTPLSEHKGGFGEAGEKWQLICIDWSKFSTIPGDAASRDNPFPTLEAWNHWTGPHAEPPQIQADVRIIDLTHGREHVALAPNDPLRAGWNLHQIESGQLDVADASLGLSDFNDTTGITLNPGVPVTVPLQSLPGTDTTAADITGTNWYIYFQAPEGTVGTVSVSYTGASGTHSAGTVNMTGDVYWGQPIVPVTDQVKSDLAAGGVTVTLMLTSQASILINKLATTVNYFYHDPNQLAAWQFAALTLPPDEPGIGYYSAYVPHFDAPSGRQDQAWAVYRINLDTGVAAEVFRDLEREPPDPPDADPNQFWLTGFGPVQLVVASGGGLLTAEFTFASDATGRMVTFDASSSQGSSPITSYAWDFGEHYTVLPPTQSADGILVDHMFYSFGPFQVTLVVTDSSGATASVTHEVDLTGLRIDGDYVNDRNAFSGASA